MPARDVALDPFIDAQVIQAISHPGIGCVSGWETYLRSLLLYDGQVAAVIGPGLRLDRERESAGCDRDGVDVPPSPPARGVPQPPTLRPQRRERAMNLVLGPWADPAASSKPQPTAALSPRATAATARTPAIDTAPALASARATNPAAADAAAAVPALESRRYCWSRA